MLDLLDLNTQHHDTHSTLPHNSCMQHDHNHHRCSDINTSTTAFKSMLLPSCTMLCSTRSTRWRSKPIAQMSLMTCCVERAAGAASAGREGGRAGAPYLQKHCHFVAQAALNIRYVQCVLCTADYQQGMEMSSRCAACKDRKP